MRAFQGEIARVQTSSTYKLGILAVCIVMVLLPLIYIGLIGLVAFAVYYHMVHDVGMLSGAQGRGAFMVLLAYLAPLVIGVILIFFMIKPLFARPAKDHRIRSLTREGEPTLFAFVDRLCAVVHAPRPKRIHVDCDVNASASFRRGMASMMVGNDLVLTLGMPLVAGFTTRQFAGVLAHEFGHFSQGAGMRLTFIIRSISMWFTRVVYQRDQWDEWLSASTKGLDLRISWILYLAQFFVWLTRKILWVLMMIGHLVAGYMLREMEFDADRYEARLAGSDTFESTCRRLSILGAGMQAAQNDLGTFYREGRLADDLPRLIMANVDEFPDSLVEEINQGIDQSETGMFDTHPADKERIASARREQAAGVFTLERPASELFRCYDEICRNVTWDFYVGVFGPEFSKKDMHPIDDLLKRRKQIHEERKSLERFFLGSFNLLRPIPLPISRLTPPSDPKATAHQLKESRRELLSLQPRYRESWTAYDGADTNLMEVHGAKALGRAGFKVKADHFSVPLQNPQAIEKALNSAESTQSESSQTLLPFEKAVATRLASALQLLHVEQVAHRIPDAALILREATDLFRLLRKMGALLEPLASMRNDRMALGILFGQFENGDPSEKLVQAVQETSGRLHEKILEVRSSLEELRYPFEHAQGEMTMAQFVLKEVPPLEEIGEVYEAGDRLIDQFADAYQRVGSRLCRLAEKVEKVLGLPPTEVPAPAENAS